MKIIVTGGAGFIGSAVFWRLNQLGHGGSLIVEDLVATDKWKNLVPLRFSDYIDKWEFSDELDKFKGVKIIYHLGANSSTTETNSSHMIHNNYQYTRDLAEWSLANEVRFIYASSAAPYGDRSAVKNDLRGD